LTLPSRARSTHGSLRAELVNVGGTERHALDDKRPACALNVRLRAD
jgi:hypothetical protein